MDSSNPNENIVIEHPNSKTRIWLFILIAVFYLALILIVIVNRASLPKFFGLDNQLDFNQVIITNGFHNIALKSGQSWKLSYEQNHEVAYSGIVRHSSAIRMTTFAILTRDVLVTSGDFADPQLVETSVVDHHFSWRSLMSATPNGKINLFHIVPMNEEVFLKIESIKSGESITLKGWEIDRIEGWDESGNYIGYWTDTGCNTFLVTDVQITNQN